MTTHPTHRNSPDAEPVPLASASGRKGVKLSKGDSMTQMTNIITQQADAFTFEELQYLALWFSMMAQARSEEALQ